MSKSKKTILALFLLPGFFLLTGQKTTVHSNQYKLIVFEGSDWCSRCIKLEEEILNDPLFLSKINEWKIELERIDFPQRKKIEKEKADYNKSIADKYHFDGTFPTILLSRTDAFFYEEISYPKTGTMGFLAELEAALGKQSGTAKSKIRDED